MPYKLRWKLDDLFEYNAIILMNTAEKELLGVIIEKNLNFNSNIKMCKIAVLKYYLEYHDY